MIRTLYRTGTSDGIARKQIGFTLIEALVAMSIAAVMVKMAAPSLLTSIQNSRMTEAATELQVDLLRARSEASRTNSTVTVCGSADGVSCDGTWTSQRIIFIDSNSNSTVDSGETLMQVSQAPNHMHTVVGSGGAAAGVLRVRSTGQPQAAGSIAFCDTRTGSNVGKTLSFSIAGILSISKSAC